MPSVLAWNPSVVEGFLVVDKPSGVTSHDVVDAVRRATGIKKAGHAGTLDPMATGTVVVAIGRVTRLIRFLQDLEKEYEATAVFGVTTDSLDADGVETGRMEMSVGPSDLAGLHPRFVGTIQQVPPMVSALKKDGRRLYELAREGVEVERPPRTVQIHELEFGSIGPGPHPEVSFRVVCGKGTYVRSLADDLARALGGFAHLTRLRRTRTGPLTVGSAVVFDALAEWERHLITATEAMSSYPVLTVDDATADMVRTGRQIPTGDRVGIVAVHAADGTLLAMYSASGTTARPEVVLA